MTSQTSETSAYKSYLEEDMGRKGIFRWILSTDHKRIALLYLYSMMVMVYRRGGIGALNET